MNGRYRKDFTPLVGGGGCDGIGIPKRVLALMDMTRRKILWMYGYMYRWVECIAGLGFIIKWERRILTTIHCT